MQTNIIIPANPGWTYVLKDRYYPVIAWQFEKLKDGSFSRPYPVGPWGVERMPWKTCIVSPNGEEFVVEHGENSKTKAG